MNEEEQLERRLIAIEARKSTLIPSILFYMLAFFIISLGIYITFGTLSDMQLRVSAAQAEKRAVTLELRETQSEIAQLRADAASMTSALVQARSLLEANGIRLPSLRPNQEVQTAIQVALVSDVSDEFRLTMPLSGQIIRPYEKGRNEGIDILGAAGDPVLAAGDGVVAAMTEDTEGTAIIVVKHGGNLLTVYTGTVEFPVAKGDQVLGGEIIGTLTPSQNPYLHFEIREGLDSIDPLAYFGGDIE